VNAGLATDRLRVTWDLNDPEVVRRLQDPGPLPPETAARVLSSQVLLETEPGEAGLRVPKSVEEPTSGFRSAVLEVPFDLEALREHQPDCLRPWRQATREAFRACFDLGARVDDFAVVSRDHERRAYYLLSPVLFRSLSPVPETAPKTADAPGR
jgi:predicted GNAT superfamily acetyltransferase